MDSMPKLIKIPLLDFEEFLFYHENTDWATADNSPDLSFGRQDAEDLVNKLRFYCPEETVYVFHPQEDPYAVANEVDFGNIPEVTNAKELYSYVVRAKGRDYPWFTLDVETASNGTPIILLRHEYEAAEE